MGVAPFHGLDRELILIRIRKSCGLENIADLDALASVGLTELGREAIQIERLRRIAFGEDAGVKRAAAE